MLVSESSRHAVFQYYIFASRKIKVVPHDVERHNYTLYIHTYIYKFQEFEGTESNRKKINRQHIKEHIYRRVQLSINVTIAWFSFYL